MAKSPDAFRTISEVSAWLETPPHVLRFWESKFPQVKPVKRAGGRRYYRPEDMALLGGIKVLLHEQGMTIRGVQKMLREQGVRHVSSLSAQAWDGLGANAIEEDASEHEAALDDALDETLDGVEAEERPLDGVIVGPWAGQEPAEAADEDAAEADLATLDGTAAEEIEEAEPDALPPTLIEAFLAGTLSRLNAVEAVEGAAGASVGQRGTMEGAAPTAISEAVAAGEPEWAPAEPLPVASAGTTPSRGEPTFARALELLRRADPERLRARAERIAPLLVRLRRLREGVPRRSA